MKKILKYLGRIHGFFFKKKEKPEKMDDHFLKIYTCEVLLQKKFAIKSYNDAMTLLKSRDFSNEDFFFHIHHFLIHVTNILKILYPPIGKNNPNGKDLKWRAKEVKKAMNIGKPGIEINHMKARNDLEHYDERIDEWRRESKRHDIVDLNITPRGAIAGMEDSDYFRNFDPETLAFTFMNKDYKLKEIAKFIEKIK